MTYADAIQFLYSLQVFGAQPGLGNTFRLAELAGDPQQQLCFIHVAGTNGKGSTCAMLESIYRATGLRVGLYTSPHLVSFRERIQINRELIRESDVVRLVFDAQQSLSTISNAQPTLFEIVTVMALRYFAEQKCDLVIWETGLGGRLDATNIVTPLVSVITNVQFDHEAWLGSTLEEIAREKAGIIKPRVPVVTAAEGVALDVIREIAAQSRAPLHVVRELDTKHPLGLPGQHQRCNAAVAKETVQVLEQAIPVSRSVVEEGLRNVDWPARFQRVQRGPQTIVLDGAHNPAGAEALAATLRAEAPDKPLTLILGILEDKNWQSVCRTLAPLATRIVATRVPSDRTTPPEKLADFCHTVNSAAAICVAANAPEAIALTAQEPLVVIAGSLYLVGEVMELLGLIGTSGERGLNEWSTRSR
ncbi:MAG TPA: folylpolyglutamate synthase/dihydrofolate synthase family protein [Methylomirabilota bacterium]|nr:folylpolyglutamate synthase/dihydrofolate synthase family protein [Methylomirabilota bacterium]